MDQENKKLIDSGRKDKQKHVTFTSSSVKECGKCASCKKESYGKQSTTDLTGIVYQPTKDDVN